MKISTHFVITRQMLGITKLIFCCGLVAGMHAAPAHAADLSTIKTVIQRYQQSEGVVANVEKEVVFGLMQETKLSQGTMAFSKGRLRLQIEKPEASLIVMNKNAIWIETPTPKELGGKTQVLKIVSKDLGQQARAPLAVLLGHKNAWDQFKIKKTESKKEDTSFVLKPLKPQALGDIMELSLTVDTKNNTLKMIGYKDELDNETKFVFSKIQVDQKISEKKFNYKPPANSELTEFK